MPFFQKCVMQHFDVLDIMERTIAEEQSRSEDFISTLIPFGFRKVNLAEDQMMMMIQDAVTNIENRTTFTIYCNIENHLQTRYGRKD